MTISDIITLVSLMIAIVAIISEKNRKNLLLKFHVPDFILFSVAFILINYFVFYEQFYSRGVYIPSLYFFDFGFNNPKHYAYIISILTLGYFFYKIWFAFYPSARIGTVLKFYNDLIESNEIPFLLDLLDGYHKGDIIKMIQKARDYNEKEEAWWNRRRRRRTRKELVNEWLQRQAERLFPYSWQNRKSYAVAVLHRILNNPAFVALSSNIRPYFWTEIFVHFRQPKRGSFPTDLLNQFLKELLTHRNFWLKQELKQSQNHDYGQPEWFHDQNKILSGLLRDLSVADVNEVWRPFGDIAVDEIEEERSKGYGSKMFEEFREEQYLWEFRTYYSIQFFKILIVEAMVKGYTGSHFWLFYYNHIIDAILETFKRFPPKAFEKIETVYHKLIKIIIDNLFLWLDVSSDNEARFHYPILESLGRVIHSICENPYYGEKRKLEVLDWLLTKYCSLEHKQGRDKIRAKIEQILLRPSMLTDPGSAYYTYIEEAWIEFDKIPHKTMSGLGEDFDYFKRLKEKVIVPLGFDPDVH